MLPLPFNALHRKQMSLPQLLTDNTFLENLKKLRNFIMLTAKSEGIFFK
jgi:hypothetical protein